MSSTTADTHDTFYRKTVTFAAKSEAFWARVWPWAPAWAAPLAERLARWRAEQRSQARQGQLGHGHVVGGFSRI